MTKMNILDSYKDYGRVMRVTNGVIEAYVTLDLGPRIIRFGFVDGQNLMNANRDEFEPRTDAEYEAYFGKGKKWENFGGHRLWVSPEAYPKTYSPDDSIVGYEVTEYGAIFTPKAECENGIQKQIEIKMDKDDANMQVTLRVKNISEKPQEFSVWSLSVAEKDGTLVLPMNDNDTGLLPNRIISVWPYTDLRDDRIYFGSKYATVRQDISRTQPIKLGFDLNKGTAYYCLGEDIFAKVYETHHSDATYPDGGCSFETYTNEAFLEIETLSPLKSVKPQETLSLTEHWSLHKKPCEVDFKDDKSIDNMLKKI